MLRANQIRAARALLNWSQGELVEKSGLSLTTIRRMEDDKIGPERSSAGNVAAVTKIIEDAGVVFLNEGDQTPGGPGVRIKINKNPYEEGRAAHAKDPLKGQRSNPYVNTDSARSLEFIRGFQDAAEGS